MSRDRLAAMRAQQANRAPRRTELDSNGYGYNQEPSIPAPANSARFPQTNGPSHEDSYQQQSYGSNNQQYPQAYQSSIPPPNEARSNQGHAQSRRQQSPQYEEQDDEETRGQLARSQNKRRLSVDEQRSGEAGSRDHPPSRNRSQRQEYTQQASHGHPQQYDMRNYGLREEEEAYHEKNQSRVALNNGDEGKEKYAGYPPHISPTKARNLAAYEPNPQTYQISALPHHGQPRSVPFDQRNPSAVSRLTDNPNIVSDAPVVDMNEFFDEIQSIRAAFKDLDGLISYLDQLYNKNLVGAGGDAVATELERVADQTRKLTSSLRQRIKALQETTRIRTHGQAENERQTRKVQTEGVRQKYLDIVQSYQNMEMRNRDKAKQKIERQYRIVEPDATAEEVREVVDGGQETQVFAQAVSIPRLADARGVLNEVQTRHEDIKRIERTLVELFHLFQDMAVMVEEQDEAIIHIEQKAEQVAQDMETGHKEIVSAVKSAKGARKKRKICLIILLILLLIIGGVVAYVVVKIVIPKVNGAKANNNADHVKTVTQTETKTTEPQSTSSSTRQSTTSSSDSTTSTTSSQGNGTPTGAVQNAANLQPAIPTDAIQGRGLHEVD